MEAQEAAAANAPPVISPTTTNADGVAVGATAAQQLESLQAQLQGVQMRLKDTHPDVIRLKRAVAEMQKKVDAEALARPITGAATPSELARKNRIGDAKAELQKIDKQIADRTDAEQRLRNSMAT